MDYTKVPTEDENINMIQNNIETALNYLKSDMERMADTLVKIRSEIRALQISLEERNNG